MVIAAEISSEPKRPNRFEKKKNNPQSFRKINGPEPLLVPSPLSEVAVFEGVVKQVFQFFYLSHFSRVELQRLKTDQSVSSIHCRAAVVVG
jgi:hypothetical protein